jgi:hypothetical protein
MPKWNIVFELMPPQLNGVRKSAEAKRIAARAYPYRCCVVCGRTSPLHVAHLDHDPGNNAADNLAWMCPLCHWNYDGDLLPVKAIRILRRRWQQTKGVHFRKDPKMVVATGKANPFRKSSGAGQRTETVLALLAKGPRLDSEVRRLSGVRPSTVNTLLRRGVIKEQPARRGRQRPPRKLKPSR